MHLLDPQIETQTFLVFVVVFHQSLPEKTVHICFELDQMLHLNLQSLDHVVCVRVQAKMCAEMAPSGVLVTLQTRPLRPTLVQDAKHALCQDGRTLL